MRCRRTLLSGGLLTLLGLVAGCGASSVSVPAPAPTGAVAAQCRRLVSALPADIDKDLRHRHVSPASPFTAAWGSPASTLRCGLPKPAAFVDDTQLTVSGVCWGTVDGSADPTIWHPRGSTPYLEVSVPLSAVGVNVLAVVTPLLTPSKCSSS
jgi:hypothetical protein